MIHEPSLSELSSRRNFLKRISTVAAGVPLASLYQPGKAQARIFGSDKSRVAFRKGADRREITYQALKPFQKEVEKAIGDRQVVIKANAGLAEPRFAAKSTHADQLRGILDFLKPIHDKKVIITEGTATVACSAFIGFENYNYMPLEKEYNVKLIDANDQPYTLKWIRAAKHHPLSINIIDIYMDQDVYLISAARMKTHNCVVATLSLKNVAMGSPVCHYKQKRKKDKNEKSKMHGGEGNSGGRELSYNLFRVAEMGVQPDLAVIDGVEAVEGDGPWGGTPVEHEIALASTDFVAADRMGAELMGIDPKLMKYLEWCGDAGMGNFDLSNIKVDGPDYKKHIIKYKMNKNIDWQIAWIHENFGE